MAESKVGSFKKLLTATSLLEGTTGLALMIMTSSVTELLFGAPLKDPISMILTRIGGAAVVSLAIACWFSRKSESINGLIIAIFRRGWCCSIHQPLPGRL